MFKRKAYKAPTGYAIIVNIGSNKIELFHYSELVMSWPLDWRVSMHEIMHFINLYERSSQ